LIIERNHGWSCQPGHRNLNRNPIRERNVIGTCCSREGDAGKEGDKEDGASNNSSDVPAGHKQPPCSADRPNLRRDPMESFDRRDQSADVWIKYFKHGSLSIKERVPRRAMWPL
jgi:hypothetical protein